MAAATSAQSAAAAALAASAAAASAVSAHSAAASASASSSSSLAYDAWSKHVHSGQPMMIREINQTALIEQMPPAVRIRAQLVWFDGGASIAQCCTQQAVAAAASATNGSDAMEDAADPSAESDDAAASSAAASSGSGVLQLRSGSDRLLVDTSLLHSASQWSTTARAVGADGESSSSSSSALSTLQFEPGGWYEVIGELMRSAQRSDTTDTPAAASTVYVRARVCRALDDSFDAQLYEETVMLRRKLLAER